MTERRGLPARFQIYTLVCFAVFLAASALVYCGTRLVLPHLTLHMLTGPLDEKILFSPPWIVVYLLCFPFWIATGLWILSGEKAYAYRCTAAYVLVMLLTGAAYLIWPGTMERPEVTGAGVFNALIRFVYSVDSPTNLCPSMHVIFTYFCFRGALGSRHIPAWYKVFTGVWLVLVCCCVLLVKQHALIDVPAGILTAEVAWQLGRLLRTERIGFAIDRTVKKH